MSRKFDRDPNGWRFQFGGLNTKDVADALPPNKYKVAQNIRAVGDYDVQTRSGCTLLFQTDSSKITDIRAYTTLNSDALPRYLARNGNNQIYLDTGALVGSLAGAGAGAFMIPYRPNQSTSPWMYVASPSDYQKFSTPGAITANTVTQYKVGIREPAPLSAGGNCLEASPSSLGYYSFSALAVSWANGGTAGAPSNATRVSDIATTTIVDPDSSSHRWSIQVATNKSYQVGELLNIVKAAGGSFNTIVQDVIPPINAGAALTVQAIFYYSGTTGRCVIVPTQLATDPSVPVMSGDDPSAASIYSKESLSSLRRGALVRLNATETCLVLAVTTGPNGQISFEVTTTGAIAAGQSITGLPTIIVGDISSDVIGQVIQAVQVNSTLTGAGEGTLTQALATNPFTQALSPSTDTAQSDDYVCFGVNVATLSKLVQGIIIFDVKNGVADYATDTYYYIFNISNIILPGGSSVTVPEPSDPVVANPNLAANYEFGTDPTIDQYQFADYTLPDGSSVSYSATLGAQVGSTTPLPLQNWATVMVPIRQLVRLGNDLTRSLINCQGVRVSLTLTQGVADTCNVGISSFWVGGGGQPDVAANMPYFYVVRPRDSHTGARGNPSPMTRYGASPRRQKVLVSITDTVDDPQFDTWDVFRFGGIVRQWRYAGSIINSATSVIFTDNLYDTSVNAGDLLERDNYEPWPSIDIPYTAIAGVADGVTTTIQVVGTTAVVIYSAAAPFTNPAPTNIESWLPGTLVILGGQDAYTLWSRPIAITLATPPTANYYAYLFQFVENAGNPSPNWFTINEPQVANQKLPYLWGPDAEGTIYACGDPLRPGTIYYSKRFNPDSAPTRYNQELTDPSEPLLGGEIIDGVSVVASPKRWWILYPSYGTTPTIKYTPVEAPVGAGLAAPYGHCTDGVYIYLVGKDGIYRTSRGKGESLSNTDLYNLFPHDNVKGQTVVYAGYTIVPPDYSRAAAFRLCISTGFLYFDYQDADAVQRTLVLDVKRMAWSVDKYHSDVVTTHYAIEQPEGSLLGAAASYPLMVLGDFGGNVYEQTPNTNDFVDGVDPEESLIESAIGTFESNGGDIRGDELWLDIALNCLPQSDIQASAITSGALAAPAVTIPAGVRGQTIIPIGVEANSLGLLAVWSDNFLEVDSPTTLYSWQPLCESVPLAIKKLKWQGTSFGLKGYIHIRQILAAYKATSPVTLTLSVYDGTAPADIVLPSTGGAYAKILLTPTFNKGLLYFLDNGVTADGSDWTPYFSEWEIYVGEWGRSDPYTIFRNMPGPLGISE